MSRDSHDHHESHDHQGAHHDGHHGHGSVVHGAPADAAIEYTRAFDAAVPEPGRSVVRVELDARETDWEFMSGRATRAWGFNGQVPGPTIEAHVGDVLEVHLKNSLPE